MKGKILRKSLAILQLTSMRDKALDALEHGQLIHELLGVGVFAQLQLLKQRSSRKNKSVRQLS